MDAEERTIVENFHNLYYFGPKVRDISTRALAG